MLSNEAFDRWCLSPGLKGQAETVITHIRTSPPVRRVQSSAGNVSGTYPSLKMGFAIQFESHRNELPFVYLIDHDPDVQVLYSQPAGEIKLKYRSQDDTRDVTARHTPDFFVLREYSAGWVECKIGKDLAKLAKKKPFRYQQRLDGSWFCPPGEAYASQFGLTYRVFSSQEIDWIYIENLRFLGDYLRKSPPYELLVFRNLNAQLSHRSIDVHLPRYRANVKEERLAFQNVLLTFQRQLPLEEAPDLIHQWKICYTRSIGCVGLLKNWLTKALREAVESGEKTISPALLLKHAASADRCDQYITDIEEGESSLNADPQATERLMERLGLNTRTRRTKESLPEEEEKGEPPKKKTSSPRRRVGQRNPTRDEVKKEAAGDE